MGCGGVGGWQSEGTTERPRAPAASQETEGKSAEGVCSRPGLEVECILPRFKARRTQPLVFNLLPGSLGNDVPG